MGFLQNYVKDYQLPAISDWAKDELEAIQEKIKQSIPTETTTFDETVKKYGPQIADLVSRLSAKVNSLNLSTWGDYFGLFKYIWSIAVEVWQLVSNIGGSLVLEGTDEEKHAKELEFSTQLIYFVWFSVDPLKDKFNWVPFKKSIEKWLVTYCAKKALDVAIDFFNAQKARLTTSADVPAVFLKAI